MSLARRLMLKYDLPERPTTSQIAEFYRLTKIMMALKKGNHEQTARTVAKDIFPGYGTLLRESQADSIEMLLKQIEQGK